MAKKIFFTWYINTECNYRCPYCRPEKYTTRIAPLQQIVDIWDGIYEKYGRCHVSFSGGEAFIYPSFIDILAALTRKHTVELSTNLSFDVQPLIEKVDVKRLRMGCSLHPEGANVDEFIRKLAVLKAYPFEKWVTFVAYPPFLKDIETYKKRVTAEGIRFSILPFNGNYDGREYPGGYTDAEKEVLRAVCADDEVNRRTFEFRTGDGGGSGAGGGKGPADTGPRKPVPCRMGELYARIFPDGNVYRCCHKQAASLGNIFDGTFKLLEGPADCTNENCPCWKRMVAGQEAEWNKYWFVPWGTEQT